MKNLLLPAILATTALSLSPGSTAAEELPNIIVTAEFRPLELQDTAISASVVTEAMIAARAAEHLQDILGAMPNVNFSGGTNRARSS